MLSRGMPGAMVKGDLLLETLAFIVLQPQVLSMADRRLIRLAVVRLSR